MDNAKVSHPSDSLVNIFPMVWFSDKPKTCLNKGALLKGFLKRSERATIKVEALITFVY
jgi:hypothetical protein